MRAAEERAGPDGADHDMRVGRRGLGAALAVAGRPGIGAGALRADAQHAAIVDPGDRAAAGADRDDVEHRRADRQAVDLAFRGERRPSVLHQADVGRGAAHVEGDQVLEARARRLARRADHAGGRAGIERGDGALAHRRGRQASAVRLHHREAAREAGLGQPVLEAVQVAIDHRLHIGRQQRRRGALELAELARHLMAAGDQHAGQRLGDQRRQPLLMRGIGVGVEQADRDRAIAAGLERRDQRVADRRLHRAASRPSRRRAAAPSPRSSPCGAPAAPAWHRRDRRCCAGRGAA